MKEPFVPCPSRLVPQLPPGHSKVFPSEWKRETRREFDRSADRRFTHLCCLLCTFVVASASAAIIDENFNAAPNGAVPTPFSLGGTYGVQSTVYFGASGKSVRLDDSTAGDWSGPTLATTWAAPSGSVTVQWKFQVPVTGANIKQFRMRVGATEAVSPVIVQLGTTGGVTVYPNAAGAAWTGQSGGAWIQNQWHTVQIDFNLISNTFSYKFDGTQLITDNIYRSGTNSSAVKDWVAYPMVQSTTGTAFYVDDFYVAQGGAPFPANAMVDVTLAPYYAPNNGASDATSAIQAAIHANVGKKMTLYFPDGIYLVSNRLDWKTAGGVWGCDLSFQGQSRAGTKIRLADSASGYNNPGTPKAVLYTAGQSGESGNQGFRNSFHDMTIEIGTGNSGAIAIDYHANNQGTIRNVTVNALGSAYAGIAMTRNYPGPCLMKNVSIGGFQYGMRITAYEYSITMEDITLSGQTVTGIYNDRNAVFVRHLTSNNTVPAITNHLAHATCVLLNSDLSGGASGNSAIVNDHSLCPLYARDVMVQGYGYSLNTLSPNALEGEYSSSAALKAFTSSTEGQLLLDIQETPEVAYETDLSQWASVQSYMSDPDAECTNWTADTAAIQAALNSGKSTIYFPGKTPNGSFCQYFIGGTLTVPATVKRIIGFGTQVGVVRTAFQDPLNPVPLFRINGAGTDPLVVERCVSITAGSGPDYAFIWFVNETARPLILQHLTAGSGGIAYESRSTSGPLYIQDVCAGSWRFLHSTQKVWARQMNPENDVNPKITNTGSDLWVLGLKTERASRVLEASGHSRTEILGGFFYPADPVIAGTPCIHLVDAKFSGSFIIKSESTANLYPIIVSETRSGVTQTLLPANTPTWGGSGYGKVAALYSGFAELINENFDSTANGTVPSPFTLGGTYGAQSAVYFGGSGKSVRLDDSVAGDWAGPALSTTWTAPAGSVTVKWKFQVPVAATNIKQYRIRAGATTDSAAVILQLNTSGSVTVYPNAAGAAWTGQAGGTWTQNQWHTVQVTFNLINNTFSYQFDGTQLITNNVYRTGSSTAITGWMAYPMVQTTTGAALYVDDFSVAQ